MDLSNSQRLAKLIGNLVTNPDLIVPYFKMSIFSRKLPIDFGMPWWSFRAIDRADGLLSGKSVFEYGTGGSTLRFAKIAKKVVSVEDHSDWMKVVQERLTKEIISNVEIRLRPFDFKNPVNFESSEYISAVDGEDWDVVIIDGQDWSFKQRLSCFRRVEPKMLPGSIIIVDDFWRYEELLSSNRAKSVEVYESVGPSRIGVTSTAFFFY
jgi:predicted RNA methylase